MRRRIPLALGFALPLLLASWVGAQAPTVPAVLEGSWRATVNADGARQRAMAAFRPRRWRGAILPKTARVRIDVLNPAKRPMMADADGRSVRNVVRVDIQSESAIAHRILFDPGHGLEERLIREQFV